MSDQQKGYIYVPYIPLYIEPFIDIEKYAKDFIERSREIEAILDIVSEHLKANGFSVEIVRTRYGDLSLYTHAHDHVINISVVGRPAGLKIRLHDTYSWLHQHISVYDPDFLQKLTVSLQRLEACE